MHYPDARLESPVRLVIGITTTTNGEHAAVLVVEDEFAKVTGAFIADTPQDALLKVADLLEDALVHVRKQIIKF